MTKEQSAKLAYDALTKAIAIIIAKEIDFEPGHKIQKIRWRFVIDCCDQKIFIF